MSEPTQMDVKLDASKVEAVRAFWQGAMPEGVRLTVGDIVSALVEREHHRLMELRGAVLARRRIE